MENYICDFDFEKYQKSGGLLRADTIHMALKDLVNDTQTQSAPEMHQARRMINHVARPYKDETPVSITSDQARLYATLRKNIFGLFSDQGLMAEVVLLTDPASYEAFTKKYPNIFGIQAG